MAVVLALCIATARSAPSPSSVSGDDARSTGSLNASMAVIGTAFREANAAHLKPLMPAGGKVFLTLDTLGDETGYFGSDQIFYIFQRIFRTRGTVTFNISVQGEATRGKKGQAYCVGSWSFRTRDDEVNQCQIFFVLAERNGHWSLVKIREAL